MLRPDELVEQIRKREREETILCVVHCAAWLAWIGTIIAVVVLTK